jgi:hypothetical protein
VQLFNLSFAVEYGVIDWVTAALQWAPGWTVWSNADNIVPSSLKTLKASKGADPSANVNGVADLFLGAKVQLIGEKAPFQSSRFRFAIGPGVVIPLPGPDFGDEVDKSGEFTLNKMDNHVFATGARLYFDYIINEHFFINAYNETLFYPIKQDLDKHGPELAAVKAGLVQAGVPDVAVAQISGDVNYKYRLTFEVEPVYTTPIAQGITLSAGLPINYRFIPAYDYSVSAPALIASNPLYLGALAQAGLDEGKPQHSLNVKPNVNVFFTGTPMPLEFKLSYDAPVWGKNIAAARHSVTLQVKVYFALPGRPE